MVTKADGKRTGPELEGWARQRDIREKIKHSPSLAQRLGIGFKPLARKFQSLLKFTPLHDMGRKNAANPRLVHQDLVIRHLPRAFEGYRILHLTDLHLNGEPGLAARTADLIRRIAPAPDICLITGDFAWGYDTDAYPRVYDDMEGLSRVLNPPDGVFGVLGNHDSWQMKEPLEKMGIDILVNESRKITRQGQNLIVTGLDDPRDFFTPEAVKALEHTHNLAHCNALESSKALDHPPKGFKIALVHTPELYAQAALNGYDLYLTGHTHAGQICLPGGKPIMVHLKKGRRFYKGVWQYRSMTGYTGQGIGTDAIPIRLNTFSEVTVLTLCSPSKEADHAHP